MTLTDDELSKLIELAEKEDQTEYINQWGANINLLVGPTSFRLEANPTTVKAMAEELLAARAVLESLMRYLEVSSDIQTRTLEYLTPSAQLRRSAESMEKRDATYLRARQFLEAIRAKNEGE